MFKMYLNFIIYILNVMYFFIRNFMNKNKDKFNFKSYFKEDIKFLIQDFIFI